MNNSNGVPQIKFSLPNINVMKVVMVINLWIFLFVQFFVLVPVSAYAAVTSKLTDVTYSQSFKSGEVYDTKVTVSGAGNLGITKVVSILGRQISTPKSIQAGGSFNFEIKCGDTVTITIGGVDKEIKSPACTGKPDGDFSPSSTCTNPVGWIEDVSGRGENYSKYFFAVDRKKILATDNIKDNPDKFLGTICVGTSKQNYQDKDKKFQKIDNKIIAEQSGKFAYSSIGNDYKAYFARDAKDGFKFTTAAKGDIPSSTIEVVKVTVGGKELKSPKPASISGDSITYYSVLPDIDLVYQLDNTGVTKQLVLRNQNALKNDLSKIEFELAGATLKKESATKDKLDKKVIDNKVDKKSTAIADIKMQKAVVDSVLPVVKTPAPIKIEDKGLNELASSKSAELDKLAKQIEKKENVDVVSELDRIDNLPVSDESVTLTISKSSVKIDLPISYSQNDSSLLKSESVKVSADGKTLMILPDVNSLKNLDKKSFPYIIDPRFYGYLTPAEDTYVGNDGTTNASRGWQRAMIVGGRPEGGYAAAFVETCGGLWYSQGVQCNIGDAEAYIKFYLPSSNEINAASIADTRLILRQYGAWNVGDGFNAQIIAVGDFSEGSLTYYNQPPEYGEFGNINFSNVNTSAAGNFLNAWSSDISQLIKEGNKTLALKIKDRNTGNRAATFCSKDGNIAGHPCNQSWNGPLLQIYLKGKPSSPVSDQPYNGRDIVGKCTGVNCRANTIVKYDIRNFWDGYQNSTGCDNTKLMNRKYEKNSFGVWRQATGYDSGSRWGYMWTERNDRISDFGIPCSTWSTLNYDEIKMNGTYAFHGYNYSEYDWVTSDFNGESFYTVDNSAPVQVGSTIGILPKVTKESSLTINLPQYFDDARHKVVIKNDEGGVLDTTAGTVDNSADVNIPLTVYPTWVNNHFQQFIMEGNGMIRSVADGKCITFTGNGAAITAVKCYLYNNFASGGQKWIYVPETRQIKSADYNTLCMSRSGSSVYLEVCNESLTRQRWGIDYAGDPEIWSTVNWQNKELKYKADLYRSNGTLYREGVWATKDGYQLKDLEEGSYYVMLQVKDRLNGDANYSTSLNIGSFTVDRTPPVLKNFTNSNRVISPNNSTSQGVADFTVFTYDYFDAYPYEAWLNIVDSAGKERRRLGWDPSTIPPSLPAAEAGARRQYFKWDGKDNSGNYLSEGEYHINAYATDVPGNVTYYNGKYPDGNDVKILVDNTGSNISVVLPVKNYWTNSPSYNVNGGLGYLQQGIPNAYELKSLQINGKEVTLNQSQVLNGQGVYIYDQPVTLAPGENKFTFQTTDQVGNKVTGYSQLDKQNLQVAQDNVLNINYDPSIPKITSIVDATSSTAPINSKSMRISFSDTYSGVDISAINIDLYTSNKDSLGSFSANLIANSKLYPNTTLVDSFNCTQTECLMNLKNLPVGYYQLFVTIKDKSPNSSCTFMVVPYSCLGLANFEKVIQVGTPTAGNLVSNTESNKSINDLDVYPTYDGVNSDQIMQQLKSGLLNISQVQGAKFRVKVSQGTEAVDIDFSEDTALGVVCASPNDTLSCKGRIATINATLDERRQYEQINANLATSSDSYDIAKSKGNITVKKCEISECVWEYIVAYPKEFSGKPKAVVTSYRSGTNGQMLKEKKYLQWEILGQVKTEPRVVSVDKVDNSGNRDNLINFNGLYYTNSINNRFEIFADPQKPYSLIFRNGSNIISKTFTNDQYGSTSLQVAIPDIEGTWEVVYNGIVVQKFIYDKTSPIIKNINYKNLSTQNGILPFVRKGDRVEYTFESSESLWEESLLTDTITDVEISKVLNVSTCLDTFRMKYSISDAVCNSEWSSSLKNRVEFVVTNFLNTVTGQDGRVRAEFSLTDFAGNKVIYKNSSDPVVYSTTPKSATPTNWNLFADTVAPDAPGWNTNGWGDGVDGVNADGVKPEKDRISDYKMVIRGNNITLVGRGEKYARMIIRKNGIDSPVVIPTNSNCVAGINTVTNGTVVKFGELCDLNFSYTFTGNGGQDAYGEPTDQNNFTLLQVDLAGNFSVNGNTNLAVWNDRTGAGTLTRSLTQNGGEMTDRYVRTNKVTDTSYGERKADVEYQLVKNGVLQSTRVQRMGDVSNVSGGISGSLNYIDCSSGTCKAIAQKDEYRTAADFQIGNTASDDVTGCVQVINGKRTGICQDGIYEIKARQIDTAGNSSISNSKIVERDTVAPSAGTLSINKVGNTLGVTISGESGATGVVTVSSAAGTKTMEYALNGTSQPIPNVLGYEMQCGGIGYGVSLKIRDAAGNLSQAVSLTTNTDTCTVCTAFDVIDKSTGKSIVITESTIWQNPLRGQNYQSIAGSEFGAPRVWNGVTYPHEGLDEQAVTGTPVKSTRSGIVVQSGSNGSKGNYVLIDHLDGFQSQYLHLSERSVVIGQKVDESTVIGKVGMTGNADGPHLHFDIIKNGNYVNPSLYLTKANIKENAVVISENKDFKLVRYGGSAACNVPLSLPPEKATPVTGGSTTPGTSENSDDWLVSNINDILNHRVNYEIDPSAYLENNFNDLVDILKKETDEDTKNFIAISKTLNCLSILSPIGANPLSFIDSLKSCFSLSSVDWDSTLKFLNEAMPYFGSGFGDGYWSGVKNIWEGPMGLFGAGNPTPSEIVNVVLVLSMLWGISKGGVDCVTSLFTNCSMLGDSANMAKDFLWKMVSNQWDSIKAIWTGIIGLPKLISAIIKGVNDMYAIFDGATKKMSAMLLFTIIGILTGKSSDITQDIFTTSMLMSGAILQSFKNQVADQSFKQKIRYNTGFIVGIMSELASEQVVIWGITALSEGVATAVAIAETENKLMTAISTILKIMKFTTGLVLFDSLAVFSILKNMYTMKTWNVLKAAGTSLSQLKQFAKDLILELRTLDGKIVMLWEDLIKFLKWGDSKQVVSMLRVDEGLTRSLIAGISRYTKNTVAVSELAAIYPILTKVLMHEKFGEYRWVPELNKWVVDGIHLEEAFTNGTARASKFTTKAKVIINGRETTWRVAEKVESLDETTGNWIQKLGKDLKPANSSLWAVELTEAERLAIEMEVMGAINNPKNLSTFVQLSGAQEGIGTIVVSTLDQYKKSNGAILNFGVFIDKNTMIPISIYPKL